MLATEQGLGKHETAIFPIQIFKVKEGVNYNQDTNMNNEYLFTNEKSRQTISSNLSHNKRYSINITDYNIYKRNDITKINKQDKFYINHAIIPNNYQTKLSNNNYLDNSFYLSVTFAENIAANMK